jgi:hypothetical protein
MKLLERDTDWLFAIYESTTGDLYLEVLAGT